MLWTRIADSELWMVTVDSEWWLWTVNPDCRLWMVTVDYEYWHWTMNTDFGLWTLTLDYGKLSVVYYSSHCWLWPLECGLWILTVDHECWLWTLSSDYGLCTLTTDHISTGHWLNVDCRLWMLSVKTDFWTTGLQCSGHLQNPDSSNVPICLVLQEQNVWSVAFVIMNIPLPSQPPLWWYPIRPVYCDVGSPDVPTGQTQMKLRFYIGPHNWHPPHLDLIIGTLLLTSTNR